MKFWICPDYQYSFFFNHKIGNHRACWSQNINDEQHSIQNQWVVWVHLHFNSQNWHANFHHLLVFRNSVLSIFDRSLQNIHNHRVYTYLHLHIKVSNAYLHQWAKSTLDWFRSTKHALNSTLVQLIYVIKRGLWELCESWHEWPKATNFLIFITCTKCIYLGGKIFNLYQIWYSKVNGMSSTRGAYLVQAITWASFLSLAWSKLKLCSANHMAGYFSNLACDWLRIDWTYSEQETENWPWTNTHSSPIRPLKIIV